MTDQWVVLLRTATDTVVVYGPMDARQAEEYATWLTATVDPAIPVKLASPLGEMLGWWRHEMDRNECTHGADCPVHPDVNALHNFDAHPRIAGAQ
jgi:hypothetical protein